MKFNIKSNKFFINSFFAFFPLMLLLLLSASLTMAEFNNFGKSPLPPSISNFKAFAQYSIAPISPSGPTVNDPNLKVQMVFPPSGKGNTSMAFLAPNDILVLEKNTGKVDRILDGKLLPNSVLDAAVANYIERGLLGIAVAPTLSQDGKRYVYLYYTQAGGGTTDGDEFTGAAPPKGNMIYRYEWVNNQLVNPTLLMQLPANLGSTGRPEHNGGKVAIGPDGNIYAVIGDVGGHETMAQNVKDGPQADGTSGILRVTPNGHLVPNSPFGDEPPLGNYFAYGIRNSFGIAFDPLTGNLWDTENGPSYGDEINLVNQGFNSGWKTIQGFAKESQIKHKDLSSLASLSNNSRYSQPKFEWDDPVGPTALVFLNSDKLGSQYKGDLFVGDINNGNIYHFKLSDDRTELLYPNGQPIENKPSTSAQIPLLRFGLGFGGIADLQIGPDGFLYALTANGAVFRIVSTSFDAANPTPYAISSFGPQGQQQLQSVSKIPANTTNKVTIVGVKGLKSYDPSPIKIKAGDTVTWINVDVIAHTVTSGKEWNHLTSGKLFHSGSIISNTAYSHTFASPGDYYYICKFHPDMKGKVVVKSK